MKGLETKHTQAFRRAHLKSGETVEVILDGWIGDMMGKGDKQQHNGCFILTNERACFYRKGVFGEVLETIPIAKITSVEIKTFMGHQILRIHTSHDGMAFKTFEQKPLFDMAYAAIERLRDASTHFASLPPAAPADDPLAQVAKLAELHAAGILTDAEFGAKKAELLARL